MMGVYPPGSLVQLTDDRYAVVESVNAARPLKPKVSVHDAQSQEPGLVIDLAQHALLGIRRSVNANQLPAEVRDRLLPRHPTAWFFEAGGEEAAADEQESGPARRHAAH
jgi:hypothetical protein